MYVTHCSFQWQVGQGKTDKWMLRCLPVVVLRLLKEAADDVRYRKRFQLLFGALLSVVGQSMRNELSKQDEFVRILSAVADKVKAAKDKEVSVVFYTYMWCFIAFISNEGESHVHTQTSVDGHFPITLYYISSELFIVA